MHATTPINVDKLAWELQRHPDRYFVNSLINGLRKGFFTGVSSLPEKVLECKNLLSTTKCPDDVSGLVKSELDNNFVIGPFTKAPFDIYRVSPVGIVEGKYSKKKRLILDLSAPHNSDEHSSVNDLINKEDFSLSYIKIDDAIKIIKEYGFASRCCKLDVSNAFKLIPIHPSLWHLYGFKWENMYYFYTRLAFGCRSSPKIFDNLSIAMCWILHNNYGINTVLHLLDDFLTIDRPSANADATMKILVSVFASLEIPIAKHKTLGPVTCIEYLGIILDTIRMEARLPEDKLCRIKEYLLFFLNRKTCTKREMLSLLGHLNFAMRVIIPGRSFISYLLNIAHSVKELHHHVTLNSSCRNDLSLWHRFLDQWNGISFFIDDDIVNASDFDLYTDAASTVGFGGYFKNRWFQALWPVEMKLDTELSLSMAYMELYPIVIAAIIWGDEWSGKRILFYCDNMATVLIIKKGRSKSLEIMRLMRHGPFSSTVSDSISGTLSLPAPLRNSVELSCVINNLWSKSINSATRDAYTSGYKCFLKFRTSQFEGENIGNVMSNISEDILICFVSYCQSVLGLKYSTIKLYLAGIRHFSIANCSVNPLVDNVGKPLLRLQNILNGIKKSENKSVRQKLPITYSVLQQIYQHLQKSIFDPHLDFTMLTAAGFFGFLRCSEFTCKQSFDPALNLTMDDVVFVTDCQVNLRLKASKTDIFRHGVIIKLFKTNNNICPYVQLSKYVTSRKMNGATDNDPLLVDSSNLALRRSLFIDKLKTILSHLGLNADKYSGHSFRIEQLQHSSFFFKT
ncbi:unnamed protein product [Mytilus edulis]|uniref:Reverse transcriptase domain-containing protein n=1 Tax=Mytilus edulis TaxID=6550 RepID=A0A8S3T324_MYTED|nr:unnamed protein product [Mytilus edulis]